MLAGGVGTPDAIRLPLRYTSYVCRAEEVGVGQAGDRPVVVEEGRDAGEVRRLADRVEAERVGDVALAIAGVVDVDVVLDLGIEREEVRSPGRVFERRVVGDDRQAVRVVGAHERVEVRVVGGGIARDERRLPVAGREHAGDRRRRDEEGPGDAGGFRTSGQGSLSRLVMGRIPRASWGPRGLCSWAGRDHRPVLSAVIRGAAPDG